MNRDDWLTYLAITFTYGLVAIVPLWIFVHGSVDADCRTVSTPYQTIEVADPESYVGESDTMLLTGVEGQKRVCTMNGNTATSDVVWPTNKLVLVGSKELSGPYIPPPSTGGGAICMDGTRSYSTGRGTCSWHGGVAEWL